MNKIKLNNYQDFESFLMQAKPYYYMDWFDDETPKSYPCILVYDIADNHDSYKRDLYYTFIYKEDLL